ncbi:MAG: WYL domain-containing protein [Capnocytophaga sp.]|nr:WYL domain-containing protein [Capnocytophaga sp.]
MIYIETCSKGRWTIKESELTNRYVIFDNILLVDAYRRNKEMQEVLFFERQEKTLGLNNIEDIIEAIEKHRTVRFFYTKFWEGVAHQREMVPYALKEHKRRWYLIAAEDKEPIQFKAFGLDRIKKLEIGDRKIQRKKVNIDELFKNSYGVMIDKKPPLEIILSFDYEQGQYIKTLPLHPSQKILIDNEEEVRISLLLIPNYDFVMEICARSQYIKVLSPPALVKEVKEHLKKAYEQYL